ncbi:MAG: hypothetical protein CL927_13020 [Deltaproteobacteria bacterium]|mgnify:CR=1 FL=1|nr:hypothetical protein [Deltaproteobacteria bacterium]HCH66669.1 hypothetical protein [Deltaproteobacteria bacterium]
MLNALLWMFLGVAFAQDARSRMSDPRPDSMEALVKDLQGTDRSRRRFAIRELNRIARVSRKHEFGSLESDSTLDALQKLELLDDFAADVCIQNLAKDVEVRGCARLLGYLETATAEPVMAAALRRTESKGEARRLQRTLEILRVAAEESNP